MANLPYFTINEITSKSIEAIKVCGITYSDNEELAYEKNITDKIMKLENQIKRCKTLLWGVQLLEACLQLFLKAVQVLEACLQ